MKACSECDRKARCGWSIRSEAPMSEKLIADNYVLHTTHTHTTQLKAKRGRG